MMSHDLLPRLADPGPIKSEPNAVRSRHNAFSSAQADPLFEELVAILKRIQRTPEQRQLYEMRVQAERDYITGLEAARRDGDARGKAEGELLGKLRTLQLVLALPERTDAEFEAQAPSAIE